MIRRVTLAAAVALAVSCGGARPAAVAVSAPAIVPACAGYPWRYRVLSSAELDARKKDFLARNPGAWTMVQLDSKGLVFHLESADPTIAAPDAAHPDDFTAADLARWTEFLRRNADVFGITDAGSVKLVTVDIGARDSTASVAEVQQRVGGALVAEITIGKRPNGIAIDGALAPIAVCPRFDDETLAARVVGRRYVVKTDWVRPPPLDCGMVRHPRPDACAGTTVSSAPQDRVLDRSSVGVVRRFVDVPLGGGAFEKRYVACVDAHPSPVRVADAAERRANAFSTLTPVEGSPKLPLAVDLVTGEALDARVCPR